jgi:hypothetical protein
MNRFQRPDQGARFTGTSERLSESLQQSKRGKIESQQPRAGLGVIGEKVHARNAEEFQFRVEAYYTSYWIEYI